MKKSLPYVAMAFAILFLTLLTVVWRTPIWLAPFDFAVHSFVTPLQTVGWSRVFLVITNFGSAPGIIVLIGLLAYLYRHRPDIIARLLLAILGSTVSGEYLKDIVHRARPEVLSWLQGIPSYSFPSGHSNASIVLYGFLALLMYAHSCTRLRRILSLLVPAAFILVIGLSRIVLNYHYASDVLGGYLLGAFWITFSLSIPIYYALYHQDAVHSEPIERPLL